jgi:hypothetical protein
VTRVLREEFAGYQADMKIRKVQRGEMVYREGEKQRSRERETVGIFMLEGLYSHTILHY